MGNNYAFLLAQPIRSMEAFVCTELTNQPAASCRLRLTWQPKSQWLSDKRGQCGVKCRYAKLGGGTVALTLDYLVEDAASAGELPDLLYCYLVIQ